MHHLLGELQDEDLELVLFYNLHLDDVLHNHFDLHLDATLHDVRYDDTLSDDQSGNDYDGVYATNECVDDMYDGPNTNANGNNLDRTPSTKTSDIQCM